MTWVTRSVKVLIHINKQSPDIAGGVHAGRDDVNANAGDQGVTFNYANDGIKDCTPPTHSITTRLGIKMTNVRMSGFFRRLRPDGETKVTTHYWQSADEPVEPLKTHTDMISIWQQ